MSKLETFEEFLKKKHMDLNPTILDDDLPDHFDHWIAGLDLEELLDYADVYGHNCFEEGKKQS